MSTKLVAAIALSMAMTACSLMSPDAKSVVSSAQKAMGSPKSIQYSGTGMNAFFGQALSAGKEWPRRDMTSYTRTINYDQKAASDGRCETAFRLLTAICSTRGQSRFIFW